MPFRLIHISDLHFSIPVVSGTAHRHSPEYLQALAAELTGEPFDRLVVSGDVSNVGDVDSLNEARSFLLDTIVDSGQRFGLNLGTMERIVVIPGNHDAYQCARDSSLTRMWQRSNINFRRTFPEKPIDPPFGSGWDWIEKDGEALFIVYADSCYMGDAKPGRFRNLFKLARRAARGDISEKQAERFRTLHTDGMSGLLRSPDGKQISKRQFSSSFKILVMHHYLFTPPGMPWKAELFMRLRQRRKVLLTLALSDFDLLLCGHSHVAHTYRSTYHQHFERKARKRFTLEYAKMVLGVRLFPRVLGARSDRFVLSKWSSFVVNLFVRSVFEKDPERSLTEAENAVVERLTAAVVTQRTFRDSIRDIVSTVVDSGELLVVPSDLVLLQRRIVARLSDVTRMELADRSKTIPAILGRFKARPFAQLMSGSASKFSAPTSPERSFAVYSIAPTAQGWRVDLERRTWHPPSKRFQGPGPSGRKLPPVIFVRNRRPSVPSSSATTSPP